MESCKEQSPGKPTTRKYTPEERASAVRMVRAHVGITRIAFEVDDTDAIYEKLRTRGDVDILGKPATVTSPTTGSLRILTFKDPHGIILEVIEHNPASD